MDRSLDMRWYTFSLSLIVSICVLVLMLASQATLSQSDKAESASSAAAKESSSTDAPIMPTVRFEGEGPFADNAFPPTVPDTQWHQDAWLKNDCLRCHETGVQDAPRVIHKDLPIVLLTAKCRTCHVLIPGQAPAKSLTPLVEPGDFAANAFPPMIPDSGSHRNVWRKDDCLLCHRTGVKDAPIVKHRDMPKILLTAKCRSCHVQVRSHMINPDDRNK